MKKRVILVLLPTVIIIACFIPYTQQQTIVINASFLNVYQQISQPKNWRKWQQNLKTAWEKDSIRVTTVKHDSSFSLTAPGVVFKVKIISGLSFNADRFINGAKSDYNYTTIPNINDNNKTTIITSHRTNFFKVLTGCISHAVITADMDNLKAFMEDARSYYGFDIRKTKVLDSNVVVERKTMLFKYKASGIVNIESDLKSYLAENHLKQVQPLIADLSKTFGDSVTIMIGVPIQSQVTVSGKLQFMHLPPNGNMLTGFFKGRYRDRQKLYDAMKTYVTDHSMSSPEVPYEKFLDNKIPLTDADSVNLQVNFPVY